MRESPPGRQADRNRTGPTVFHGWFDPLFAILILAYPTGRLVRPVDRALALGFVVVQGAWTVAKAFAQRPIAWSAGRGRRHGRGPVVVASLVGRRRDRDTLVELTPREHDVLERMAEGRSNQAIAAALEVGVKTVETHVARIFSKLGLEEAPDDHRRVLAVLTWLRGR